MTTTTTADPPTAPRFYVVTAAGDTVLGPLYRQSNAQLEADELNRTGLPQFRPYRVVAR